MSVVLDDEAVAELRAVLEAADALCTSVISGKPGTVRTAITVGSALSNLKRKKILTTK